MRFHRGRFNGSGFCHGRVISDGADWRNRGAAIPRKFGGPMEPLLGGLAFAAFLIAHLSAAVAVQAETAGPSASPGNATPPRRRTEVDQGRAWSRCDISAAA